MEKEDILAAARENRTKNEEYEKQTILRGDTISIAIGMMLGMIMFLAELFIKKDINIGMVAMFLSMLAIQTIYEGVKLHKKRSIIVGIIVAALAVLFLFLFVGLMVIAWKNN